MSVSEIIAVLPELSQMDRRAIRRKLQDLADTEGDILLCDEAALAGAMMLDELENEDVKAGTG